MSEEAKKTYTEVLLKPPTITIIKSKIVDSLLNFLNPYINSVIQNPRKIEDVVEELMSNSNFISLTTAFSILLINELSKHYEKFEKIVNLLQES